MTDEEKAEEKFIELCDDRFEIIARARKHIIEATNIEMSPKEMEVLDNFLFRCWQMGWLKNDYKDLEKEIDCYKSRESHWDEIEEDAKRIAEENAELKAQIEKMKCCANCKFFDVCAGDYLKNGFRAYIDDLKHCCHRWE